MSTRHMAGMVQGAGLFGLFMAQQMQIAARVCDEHNLPFPADEDLKLFPIAAIRYMNMGVNLFAPEGMQFQVQISATEMPREMNVGHKHFDRHGAEIPCETYHYFHDRDDYGQVGIWKSPSGNTVVNTVWVGEEDCIFETRIFSKEGKNAAWHGHSTTYATESDAREGHQKMVGLQEFLLTQ